MPRRVTIGDNPLDLVVPTTPDLERAKATTTPSGSEPRRERPREAEVPSSEEVVGVDTSQCLTFFMSGTEYAVTILHVKEIIEFRSLTPVPSTPSWIRGVMNLRGTVVPVVDLAVKFGMNETQVTKRTCIVIVEILLAGEKTVMGVMADAVSRVIDWEPGDIEPSPAFGTDVDVSCLLGMGKLDEKLVPILDIDQILLSTSELASVSGVPSAGARAAKPSPAG